MIEFLLDIAKIAIPGILVLLATYYVLNNLLKNEERNRYYNLRKETAKVLNPIRLTAYERLALFLERIQPDSLLLRVQQNGMKAKELHLALLTTILVLCRTTNSLLHAMAKHNIMLNFCGFPQMLLAKD